MKVYTDKNGNTLHINRRSRNMYAKNIAGEVVGRAGVLQLVRKATDTHRNSGKIKAGGFMFNLKYLKGRS